MRIEKGQFPPNTFFVFYPIYYTKEITEEELKTMQEKSKEDESSEAKTDNSLENWEALGICYSGSTSQYPVLGTTYELPNLFKLSSKELTILKK